MSNHHKHKHSPYCLNCHYPLSEFDKNCSQCGQKPTDGKTTMHDLLHEFVHTLFHLDGKFFWTLKHLFVPGRLTLEFFKGHHKRYAHPVQLFLVLGAFCFWLISSMTYGAEKVFADEVQGNKMSFEQKKLFKKLDSLSHTLSQHYDGFETQKAYDSLLFLAYKTNFSDEFKINKSLHLQEDNSKDGNYYKQGQQLGASISKQSMTDSVAKKVDSTKVESNNNNFIGNIKYGYNLADEEKQKQKILEQSRKKTFQDYLVSTDSSRLYPVKGKRIPKEEMYNLSSDSLIKKYKVEGWLNKIMTKQTVKIRKEGQNYFHYIIGKLLWLTLVLVPVMALFFLLLYRRQKRYYVEHFVFILHFNIVIFASLTIALPLVDNEIIDHAITLTVSTLFLFSFLYLGMKKYYQQGWIKTFIKFCLVNFMYITFGLIFLILFMLLSFILF
jgi:Protein of unknown function (DUF3667)